MHLIENYALTAGLKIGKPHISPLFYPPPSKKFITLHASSGMESKNYEHYQDVVDKILPELKKAGIDIVQVGEKNDEHIRGTISLLGKTKLRQTFYILSKSSLHFGNDSFSSHVAGFLNKPLVTVYGPVYPNTCCPYWGNKKIHISLSPNPALGKPSFSAKESKKRVNLIFPDKISLNILKLLELNYNCARTEAVHLGENYGNKIVDVIPNFTPNSKIITPKDSPLSIRLDYGYREECLDYWLSNYKSVVYINSLFPKEILIKHKKNIKRLVILLNENFSVEQVNEYQAIGCKLQLSYEGKRNISEVRLDFFGLNIHEESPLTKKDLDTEAKICDNSYYESSVSILSEGKIFSSYAKLEEGSSKKNEEKIIDSEDFYSEIKHFKIYNKQ